MTSVTGKVLEKCYIRDFDDVISAIVIKCRHMSSISAIMLCMLKDQPAGGWLVIAEVVRQRQQSPAMLVHSPC